jgi:hypothetical protein
MDTKSLPGLNLFVIITYKVVCSVLFSQTQPEYCLMWPKDVAGCGF